MEEKRKILFRLWSPFSWWSRMSALSFQQNKIGSVQYFSSFWARQTNLTLKNGGFRPWNMRTSANFIILSHLHGNWSVWVVFTREHFDKPGAFLIVRITNLRFKNCYRQLLRCDKSIFIKASDWFICLENITCSVLYLDHESVHKLRSWASKGEHNDFLNNWFWLSSH